MRNGIRGKVAGILAAVLLGSAIFPSNVIAEDVVSRNVQGASGDIDSTGTDVGEPDAQDDASDFSTPEQYQQETSIIEEGGESKQQNDDNVGSEEKQEDSGLVSEGLINYVGVVSPYLLTPEEQQIVFSFGNGTENVTDAKIICEKSDGKSIELGLSEKENELYLFKHVFEEADTGIYYLARFVYVQEGVESSIELSEIGIEAMFGVNEDYTGYQAAVIDETGVSAKELDASVVSVDLNEIDVVESDIEEAIEETAGFLEKGGNFSRKSGNKVSKEKDSALSSDTNISRSATRATGNVVVVLDPGHGGSDPGASANGLIEKSLNLNIALACKRELEQYNGVTVYMTRDSDVSVGLKERADKAKAWGADVFVSLHMNSASAGANGVEVYYPNSNYNPDVHKEGKSLAEQIRQQLVSLGLGDRGIKEDPSTINGSYPDGSRVDGYQVIRYCKLNGIPGIIVEHAFLTNPEDASKLKDSDFVRRLGVADAAGIANYFGLSKGVSVKIENKDDFDGTAEVKANGLGHNATVKIWNDTNNKPKEYLLAEGRGIVAFSISDFGNVRGQYHLEVLSETGNSLFKESFYVSKNPGCTIAADLVDKKQIEYNLNVQFAEIPSEVKGVRFATWSDKNGQDDLIWYEGNKGANGSWSATVDIRKHKASGFYNVHVYAVMSNGNLRCIGATGFTVESAKMSFTLTEYKESEGTFDVILKDTQAISGITNVEVPVWCAENQSDIYWYKAKLQNDGSYKVTVNIANHKYATGAYKIHTYVSTENGIRDFAGAAPKKMVTLPKAEIKASDTNGKETLYTLSAINITMPSALKGVRFAVWSSSGGQDDLIWYEGKKETNNVWTAVADIRKHKTSGEYNVHVYATLLDGGLKCIGATGFTVTQPKAAITVGDYNENKGVFDIVLENITSPSGVTKVEVPVWCAKDQSDIHWYEAERQNDGTYKTTVNISKHKYATGNYKIHTYVSTGNGMRAFAGAASEKMITLPKMEISAVDSNGKETTYALKVTNVTMLGAIRSVQFAVWSDINGQDDLIWYQGIKGANSIWTATADVRKHKTAGFYNVHVYATLADGSLRCLGASGFTVSKGTVTDISIQNYDDITGCFRVDMKAEAASGITKIEVPVWCAENQSDIRWYEAEKRKDGSYYVDVDPQYHNYHSGLYKIHVYITMQNGVRAFAKSTSQLVGDIEKYSIMGDTTTTVEQMMRYYESSGKTYPSVALGVGGAFTLKEFCQMYIDEANLEGVRAEVAFAQAMKETGWLQYGGIVQIGQFNFAGIGALDGNSEGNCATFPNVKTGIRAQIQHLKAYGCADPLVSDIVVDPRFEKVKRGCAPYVEYLGQKENPDGLGWATEKNYGNRIVSMIKKLKSM